MVAKGLSERAYARHRKEKGLLPVPPAGAASKSLADGCARLLEHPDASFVESLTWVP